MASKKTVNEKARARANGALVTEVLDRIQGKESALTLDFEKVGLRLGEDRWLQATGSVKLSAVLLR